MSAIAMDPSQPIPEAPAARPGSVNAAPSPAANPTDPYISPSGKLIDPGATHDMRVYCLFMHLGLAAWFVVGPFALLIPLIMWRTKKDDSGFIDDHGREAVNFQISVNLYLLVSTLLAIVCIGWPMLVASATLAIIGLVLGSIAAHRGEFFRYPACIRFI
ncbi:MAG: DUF4870 domain-containing protein [Phycisphaerales bacterium]|nr:DUF4870 domain-containing protein [Phycisphaerales bacterium]